MTAADANPLDSLAAARARGAWLRGRGVSTVAWVRSGGFWQVMREVGAEVEPGEARLGDLEKRDPSDYRTELLVLPTRTDHLVVLERLVLATVWAADRLSMGSDVFVAVNHDGHAPGEVVVARDGVVVRQVDVRRANEPLGDEAEVGEPLPEEAGLFEGAGLSRLVETGVRGRLETFHPGDGADVDGLVLLERLGGPALTREFIHETPGRVVRLDERAEARLYGEPDPGPPPPPGPAAPRRRWFGRRR